MKPKSQAFLAGVLVFILLFFFRPHTLWQWDELEFLTGLSENPGLRQVIPYMAIMNIVAVSLAAVFWFWLSLRISRRPLLAWIATAGTFVNPIMLEAGTSPHWLPLAWLKDIFRVLIEPRGPDELLSYAARALRGVAIYFPTGFTPGWILALIGTFILIAKPRVAGFNRLGVFILLALSVGPYLWIAARMSTGQVANASQLISLLPLIGFSWMALFAYASSRLGEARGGLAIALPLFVLFTADFFWDHMPIRHASQARTISLEKSFANFHPYVTANSFVLAGSQTAYLIYRFGLEDLKPTFLKPEWSLEKIDPATEIEANLFEGRRVIMDTQAFWPGDEKRRISELEERFQLEPVAAQDDNNIVIVKGRAAKPSK